jgi:hypothetical protein
MVEFYYIILKKKKINLLKYYYPSDKYPEFHLKNKHKFFFDSDNFEFFIEDIYAELNYNNKNNNNDNSNENEIILISELAGGVLALAKNQQIILYK